MDYCMPGFLLHHQHQELTQTHASSWWCHPTVFILCCSLLDSCLQSFPASGSFPISQLFASGGQNIGVLASASVRTMNIQCWFLLGFTCLISLQSKGLSRIFSNTTIQKHQFSSAQPFLWSNSHSCTWLLEKPWFDYMDLHQQNDISDF